MTTIEEWIDHANSKQLTIWLNEAIIANNTAYRILANIGLINGTESEFVLQYLSFLTMN